MSKVMWLVTTGSYSDYTVLAVAPTEAEAQRYADAYNAARESTYRDDAEVEEVDLYEDGDPLPQSVTLYNGEPGRSWPVTQITAYPERLVPSVRMGPVKPFAQNYPSPEAVQAALAAREDPS